MKIQRGYKLQLEPIGEQARLMSRTAGACRFVWNLVLEQRRTVDRPGRRVRFAGQCAELPALKAAAPFLAEAPSPCLQQTLRDLERAFVNCWERRARAPRFRSKGAHDAFRFPDPKQFALDEANARVKLPKLGWVRYRKSRAIDGAARNITVSLERGRWFMAVQTEREIAEPVHGRPQACVGVDMGVEHLAALSSGELRERLAPLTRAQVRLRRYQRAVARKKRGSANCKKARARVARIHAKCAAIRANMAHQLSHEIARDFALIAIEDLQVRSMSTSARGTAAAPGRNVRQKAGLNRAILDAGWSRLRRLLEYKAAERGGQVIAVPPAYTSQACCACGHVAAENRPDQATFLCLACGHADHADVNAAKNILAAACRMRLHPAAQIQLPADSGKVTPVERSPKYRAATSSAVRRSAREPAEGPRHALA